MHNYKLSDEFILWFEDRFGALPFIKDSPIYKFLSNIKLDKKDFIEDIQFHYSETGYLYNEREKQSLWKVIETQRNKLQDKWELFNCQKINKIIQERFGTLEDFFK